jgi:hypothetical protein
MATTFLIIRRRLHHHPNLYRKLPYSPTRDFAPVSLVGYGNFVLGRASLAGCARNVNELIALATASPEN